jgi:hypothetical protein
MIKSYSITRMARGTPLATVKPKSRLRRSRPFSARGGHLVLISHREVFGLTGEGGAKPENALLPYEVGPEALPIPLERLKPQQPSTAPRAGNLGIESSNSLSARSSPGLGSRGLMKRN